MDIGSPQNKVGTIFSLVDTGKALQSNPSTGGIEASLVTNTELGYVGGVTSGIQSQLNLKAPLASPTFTGQVIIPDGSNTVPGWAFASDHAMGMNYRAAGQFNVSIDSTVLMRWQKGGLSTADAALVVDDSGLATIQFLAQNNTFTSPAYSFWSHQDYGMYIEASNTGLGLVTAAHNSILMTGDQLQLRANTTPSNDTTRATIATVDGTGFNPVSDNTKDLGTSSLNWRTIYVSTSLKNGATTLATATELGYLSGVTSSIQTQLGTKALDSAVVHNTGTESVAGVKTFTSAITKNNGSIDDTTLINLNILGGDSTSRTTLTSFTTTGITTAKKIYDLSQYGVLLLVNLSDGSNIVTDLIWGGFGKTPSVISSFTGLGSPAARTYSEASGALKVAMTSGTYTANVVAFEMRAR